MTETTNFGLKKPEANDFYDFETQNDNLDVIDEKLKECMECGTAEKVTYENESVADVANVKEALDNIYSDYAEKSELANYLPLDGSKPITGNIVKWMNGYSGVTGSNVHSAIASWMDTNGGDCSALVIYNENAIDAPNSIIFQIKKNGVDTNHIILHTGNKPTGTYTGNGSATARTINTGGIGNAILIYRDDVIVLVSNGTSICCFGGNLMGLTADKVKFINGVLTIATDASSLNLNGYIYNYQVL